jgi:YfiH family protein
MKHAEFLQSPVLGAAGFVHAFFTRNGGVSEGPYSSLSFSMTVGDHPDRVRENLERAARVLGVGAHRLFYLSQVHGCGVHVVDGRSEAEALLRTEGDALVSGDPSVACGVRSADCVPVLLADRDGGAVAAAHAGWRGVVAGVVESAVASLRAHAGARCDLIAAIGPHISSAAFEVSEEVAEELRAASPDPDVVGQRPGARPHVDLRRVVRAKLVALGLDPSCIDDVGGCTVGEPERFFSYRRDGARSGRHLSAIRARGLHG